jgi:chemotaxis protein CheX
MKAEYINPFVLASFSVLEMVVGNRPTKGEMSVLPKTFPSDQCNIVCGISGQLHGQVIYGMSLLTADSIASAMLGTKVKSFDMLAASAIGELGNMITGNAMQLLSESGYECDITPPSIVRGTNVNFNTLSVAAILVPLMSDHGQISLTIGLSERK